MPVDNSPMSIRQHSPSCTMTLLILRSPCTQPSLSGTRSRKRCRYRLPSSLTPVMFACAAAFCETKRCFVSLRLAAFFTACASRFYQLVWKQPSCRRLFHCVYALGFLMFACVNTVQTESKTSLVLLPLFIAHLYAVLSITAILLIFIRYIA